MNVVSLTPRLWWIPLLSLLVLDGTNGFHPSVAATSLRLISCVESSRSIVTFRPAESDNRFGDSNESLIGGDEPRFLEEQEEEDQTPVVTLFGLRPKWADEEGSIAMKTTTTTIDGGGDLVDGSGVPLFTGTVVMMMSLYLVYLGYFGEDLPIDPSVTFE